MLIKMTQTWHLQNRDVNFYCSILNALNSFAFFLLRSVEVFTFYFGIESWDISEILIVWNLFSSLCTISFTPSWLVFSQIPQVLFYIERFILFRFLFPCARLTVVFVLWSTFLFHFQVKCPCEMCNFGCVLSYMECNITLRLLQWKCFFLLTQLTLLLFMVK